MAIEVKLPQFGMGMSEAQIVRWYKSPGDCVVKGEPLLEVEAAKTINEIPAPANGVLARIVAQVGDVVQVYQPLGEITAEGETANVDNVTPPRERRAEPVSASAAVVATPRARRLAHELGLDLATIVGTGSGGRVTDEDVRRTSTTGAAAPSQATDAGEPSVALGGMRGEIARRMQASLQDSAQLTLTRTVDVTALMASRESLASRCPLSYNDLIVRAVALALRRHPMLNATCDGRSIQRHAHIHIGIAVALEDGLIVPIVRDADRLSLRQLASEIRRLTELARGKKLAPADVSGGTFSVTNLGALDIDAFTPIINPPETAILGVGRITEYYTRNGDRAEWRQGMVVSLTIDHRAIDGAPGALFLRTLAALCAAPDEWTSE
ncbi:MAG TPA: dihydrolipoamide acetyltransferase family protein [Steroidobacteraceae bacterium]|jgi:pyruvate dehydrogenase E2 component (dihydrolipoamide acetyltransferase)